MLCKQNYLDTLHDLGLGLGGGQSHAEGECGGGWEDAVERLAAEGGAVHLAQAAQEDHGDGAPVIMTWNDIVTWQTWHRTWAARWPSPRRRCRRAGRCWRAPTRSRPPAPGPRPRGRSAVWSVHRSMYCMRRSPPSPRRWWSPPPGRRGRSVWGCSSAAAETPPRRIYAVMISI